jgi:hypothetical protein
LLVQLCLEPPYLPRLRPDRRVQWLKLSLLIRRSRRSSRGQGSDRPCKNQLNSSQLVQKFLHSQFRLLRQLLLSLPLDLSPLRQPLSQLLLMSLAHLLPQTLQAAELLNQKRPPMLEVNLNLSQTLMDLLLLAAKPPTVETLMVMTLSRPSDRHNNYLRLR